MTPNMVKHRLKRALVPEINVSEMAEQAKLWTNFQMPSRFRYIDVAKKEVAAGLGYASASAGTFLLHALPFLWRIGGTSPVCARSPGSTVLLRHTLVPEDAASPQFPNEERPSCST